MIREYIYFVDDNPNGTSGMTEEEIIRCRNCKFYKKDDCLGWCDIHELTIVGFNDFCSYGERIESEESVQPKRGKWILDEEESKKHIEPIYICSACKNYEAWGNTEKTPFCPNCGTRMESEEE